MLQVKVRELESELTASQAEGFEEKHKLTVVESELKSLQKQYSG